MVQDHIIYNNYSDWTFNISGAEGSFISDSGKHRLIDFTSGWNVTNLGWNNPEIAGAVVTQVNRNTYAPMWTADVIQQQLAEELIRVLPRGLDTVGRATGGTEANEEAIKTARAFTGRHKIIGFKDTYHGQSYGTMSIGYRPEYVLAISPMVGEFVQMDFPKAFGDPRPGAEILADFAQKLEQVLKQEDVAAVITEAGMITGWGSALVAPSGYLAVVKKLCQKYGALLVLDEVGTGFSRTGRMFGMQLESVTPDIVTLAKGLSNGVAAIGAMVTTNKIAEATCKNTNLTSTFGWVPVSCAAALKCLEIHTRDKVWVKSQTDGDYLQHRLKQELADISHVKDIRGIGMEIGLQLNSGLVDKVVTRSRESGLHLVCDHSSVIQIMPPLIIDRETLDRGTDILVSAIKSLV